MVRMGNENLRYHRRTVLWQRRVLLVMIQLSCQWRLGRDPSVLVYCSGRSVTASFGALESEGSINYYYYRRERDYGWLYARNYHWLL